MSKSNIVIVAAFAAILAATFAAGNAYGQANDPDSVPQIVYNTNGEVLPCGQNR